MKKLLVIIFVLLLLPGIAIAKNKKPPREMEPINGKCNDGYHAANCVDSKNKVYTCCLPDKK
jgi:hypothetical protein